MLIHAHVKIRMRMYPYTKCVQMGVIFSIHAATCACVRMTRAYENLAHVHPLGEPSNLIFGKNWDFVPTEGPSVRGGVDLVGTKSQIFPKIRFEGSP